MTLVTFSLVSHTNVGKTTLARTLLGRDIGEVRDAPHVTEAAAMFPLVRSEQGDELRLWDTPGFGDSARLVQRLRGRSNPLGWFLSEVWDRWTQRALWSSQRAMQHVQADSDVLLYLVNAAESPAAAGYVEPEMELLAWVGKPVLVLLNQLGSPRPAETEAAEVQAWRSHLARWPLVHAVLPLDAFARCWVHEHTLLRAAQQALAAAGQADRAQALSRLTQAWQQQRAATFSAAMQTLAQSLARTACHREALRVASGWHERLRRLGAALGQAAAAVGASSAPPGDDDPEAAAQARLAQALADETRSALQALLQLHGLAGSAEAEIMGRTDGAFARRQSVSEGRAAVLGGAVTGALAGLKADIVSGGLTMGGGLLAGGILGALGAAGLARGINVVRGTDQSWVAWSADAMNAAVQSALLRYLAVAHFGRGRGDWAAGEVPAHWAAAVASVVTEQAGAWSAVWAARSTRLDTPDDPVAMAAALQPLLDRAARDVLRQLYPDS